MYTSIRTYAPSICDESPCGSFFPPVVFQTRQKKRASRRERITKQKRAIIASIPGVCPNGVRSFQYSLPTKTRKKNKNKKKDEDEDEDEEFSPHITNANDNNNINRYTASAVFVTVNPIPLEPVLYHFGRYSSTVV